MKVENFQKILNTLGPPDIAKYYLNKQTSIWFLFKAGIDKFSTWILSLVLRKDRYPKAIGLILHFRISIYTVFSSFLKLSKLDY